MEYWPQNAIGFEINDELADKMGLADEFNTWEIDKDETPFMQAFKSKFKPPGDYIDLRIQKFEGERGGYTQGLEGFEYDKTYCYFPGTSEKDKGWRPFIRKLEKIEGLKFQSATWSQLG